MPKPKSTGSEPEESSSSGEQETATKTSMPEYEKQRLQRIRDNNKRMEELGLRKMASSLMGSGSDSAKKKEKFKGKAKADDDEEYEPVEEEDDLSSEDEVADDDENDQDFVAAVRKAKHKSSNPKKKAPNLTKKGSIKKLLSATDNMDEDEALKMAIALSMQESGVTDMGSSGDLRNTDKKKGSAQVEEVKGARKRKKPMTNRVQMTEDELVMHFFQFDVSGKGGINLRDLRRMVGTHDFTWSDSEMADMIKFFDNDGDGKLSLDDFRKIASRCSMISDS